MTSNMIQVYYRVHDCLLLCHAQPENRDARMSNTPDRPNQVPNQTQKLQLRICGAVRHRLDREALASGRTLSSLVQEMLYQRCLSKRKCSGTTLLVG